MTTDTEAEAPLEDDVVDAEGQTSEPTDSDGPKQAEAEARRNGWKPKDEFKGDPANWVDAGEFNRRGKEIAAIVQAQNKELRKELNDLKRTMREASDYWSKAEKRAYDEAQKDLEARLAEAAETGDVEGAKAIARDIAGLAKEVSAPKPSTPDEPEEMTDWKAENPWFAKDAAMRGAAIEIVNDLLRDEPNASIRRQLKEVDRRIREEFPHKFENPNRRSAPAVESGQGPRRKADKSFDNLPREAKQQCDSFHRMGVFGKKTLAEARTEYAKNYDWS